MELDKEAAIEALQKSEFHYKMGGYYALFESLTLNAEYMSQSFAFVEQPAFSNSLYSASVTYRF